LLPPLIIEEAEIADAIDRIERAAGRIERAQREKPPPYPPPHAGEGRVGGEAAKVDS
jgi:hypothetical protein